MGGKDLTHFLQKMFLSDTELTIFQEINHLVTVCPRPWGKQILSSIEKAGRSLNEGLSTMEKRTTKTQFSLTLVFWILVCCIFFTL